MYWCRALIEAWVRENLQARRPPLNDGIYAFGPAALEGLTSIASGNQRRDICLELVHGVFGGNADDS